MLGPLPESKTRNPYDGVDDTESLAKFKYGIVPYYIDSKTYDFDLADTIIKAFDYFEKATCIRLQRLRERPTDKESLSSVTWLYITNPSGIRQCVHSNERMETKGVQMIVFGYDCMFLGDIAHELMHVLGFSHEHTRFDRDNYISIMWDNIKPGYKKYFELSPKSKYQSIVESLPYDYQSVLHYPPRAFSRNGQVTIMTKPGSQIGQRIGLSETDIEKVSLVYSNECIKRNKDYLLKTCPSVVKNVEKKPKVTQAQIEEYFRNRLWSYGIVTYKLKDKMEFSAEERENIRAVISHIEKETCIKFQDVTDEMETPANDVQDNNVQGPNKQVLEPVNAVTEVTNMDTETTNQNTEPIVQDTEPIIQEADTTTAKQDENTTPALVNEKKEIAENEIPAVKLIQEVENSSPEENRRHAKNILVLKRSTQPGCKCPPPGRTSFDQVLQINSDCFNSVNDLLHFFVHVLGLDHQHSMHDRDQYLHIVWNKLSADMKGEMKTVLPAAASVGFPYDYQSVMHFPWLQIKNGVTNIMYPIWNDGWAMGHWQGLSSTDVQKLNLLYFNLCTARDKQMHE